MTESPDARNRKTVVDLSVSRARIDRIDAEIVRLFEERMRVSYDISLYKQATDTAVRDEKREAAVISAAQDRAHADFKRFIPRLFNLIMEMSRTYQIETIGKASRASKDEKSAERADGSRIYGLLGRSLAHSYSPKIHALLGSSDYRLFEKKPEAVEDFVRFGNYDGLNVTLPYKETVLPMCDELSDAARSIGCVNTVVRREDGTIFGDNTDYDGLCYLLDSARIDLKDKKVLVLGAGGASKTACYVAEKRGARNVAVVSRNLENAGLDTLPRRYDAEIIINATPVGMFPHCPDSLIDLEPFARTGETRSGFRDGLHAVIDLVYNPARTGILLQAEKLGIPHAGGLSMLVAQAKRASEIFRGISISEETVRSALESTAFEMRNIVLIGMPGSGKSTVGRLVAEKLGRGFADIDESIVETAGKSISRVFAEDGEEAFRRLETAAASEACKRSGLVVACGGGIVTMPRNYDILHQNAVIVFLRRPLGLLACEGRPLSISKGAEALARERERLYNAWADIEIPNDTTPDEAADRIISALAPAEHNERL